MNTSAKLLLFTLLSASTVAGATESHNKKPFHAVRQEQQVRNFNGVAIGGSIKAIIKIGSEESIRFEGNQEAISKLKIEVKDGILNVKPDSKWNDWGKKFGDTKIIAYITAKRITSLTLGGSGNIEMVDPLNTTELSTTVGGSGSIKAKVNVKKLTSVIGGSGNIQIEGKTDDFNITIGGSGSFKGKELATEKVSAQISGSGAVYVTANKNIHAVISGSGTVHYSGNATVEKTVIGSGGVRKD